MLSCTCALRRSGAGRAAFTEQFACVRQFCGSTTGQYATPIRSFRRPRERSFRNPRFVHNPLFLPQWSSFRAVIQGRRQEDWTVGLKKEWRVPLCGRIVQIACPLQRARSWDPTRFWHRLAPAERARCTAPAIHAWGATWRPSFLVDPVKNLFYCYGCRRGGDVIRYVEVYYDVRFGEVPTPPAARIVAEI